MTVFVTLTLLRNVDRWQH